MDFKCYICDYTTKQEEQLNVHYLFTHEKYRQPCSTGLAERQFLDEQELRRDFFRYRTRINNKSLYIKQYYNLKQYKKNHFTNQILKNGFKYRLPKSHRLIVEELDRKHHNKFTENINELMRLKIAFIQIKYQINHQGIVID